MELPRQKLPTIARVRQGLPPDQPTDVAAKITARLDAAGVREKIRAGQRVAVSAGSRGMAGILEMLRAGMAEVRWTRNTDALDDLWVSDALRPEVRQNLQL